MKKFSKLLLFCSLFILTNISFANTNYDFCDGCINVIDTIKYYINQNYTINEIENIIDVGCTYLGPGYSQICSYITKYGVHYLINLIKSLSSLEVCEYIYICQSNIINNSSCSLCKFITSQIINYIENNNDLNEIKHFIINICNNFYKNEKICLNILNYDLDEFIKLIKYYKNDGICKFMLLC